jgi:dTDP-4-amino-4,6-dideoxygalactose transaminase
MVFPRRHLMKLEESLKMHFGMKHVFLVSSGKTALMLILKALGALAPDKHEVLIPAYTCFSVPSAVVRAGLRVALCDIDPSAYDFDYRCLKDVPTDNTLCIIPSHLFGIPSDMDRVRLFAKERGIFVVEDAAQAMGGRYRNKLIGTIGDVGFFSLGRGKNITCMSGGVIVTNDDSIAAEIKKEYAMIKSPGFSENVLEFIKALLLAVFIRPSLYWLPSGLTFLGLGETLFSTEFPVSRLSGVGAGLMWHWQYRLEQSNHRRKENGEYLCKMINLKNLLNFSVPFLRLPYLAGNKKVRDSVYSGLNLKGLGVSLMYPSSINKIAEIKDQFAASAYPSAEAISSKLLTLPTHELLTERDLKAILEFLTPITRSSAAVPFEASPAAGAIESCGISANGPNHV